MSFIKILNHSDRNEIISRLTSGDSVRDVSSWLEEKYPDNPDKHISFTTLSSFKKKHLNIHGAAITELNDQIKDIRDGETNDNIEKIVKRNPTYKQKLSEAVETQVDWKHKLHQFINVMETRAEAIFDRMQENPGNTKSDYIFLEYMDKLLKFVQEIKKLEGAPDQIIQHNYAVQTIEDNSSIIQEAVIQTFAEVDLETSLLLMEKLAENMSKIKASKQPKANMQIISANYEEMDKKLSSLLPDLDKTDNKK